MVRLAIPGLMCNELILPEGEIYRQYAAGMSANALGRKYGVATDTIVKRLRRQGAKIRRPASRMCAILKEHKAALEDDPERLSGEFILQMSRTVDRMGEG